MLEASRGWTFDVDGKPRDFVVSNWGDELLINGEPAGPNATFERIAEGVGAVTFIEGRCPFTMVLTPVKHPLRIHMEDVVRFLDSVLFGWSRRIMSN